MISRDYLTISFHSVSPYGPILPHFAVATETHLGSSQTPLLLLPFTAAHEEERFSSTFSSRRTSPGMRPTRRVRQTLLYNIWGGFHTWRKTMEKS